MSPSDVIRIVQLVEGEGLPVWVDGGWGVDALLGEQTREHQDLDLAIRLSDVPRVRELLHHAGYDVFDDELPTRLEMRDPHGHRVDLHPLTFDDAGNGLQQLQDGRFGTYTAEGLRGRGLIGAVAVTCLSPSLQMRFHRGYAPSDDDRHDVEQLAERFGLEAPQEYR